MKSTTDRGSSDPHQVRAARLKRRDRQVLDLDKLSVDEIDELLVALAAQRPQDNSDEHDRELDGWKP